MKRNKYRSPQSIKKSGVGPNGRSAEAWWYGAERELQVFISADDGCHWAKIPRRSIEAWLRATSTSGVAP